MKRVSLTMHALVCLMLLVIPYASTDQVFRSLEPALDNKYKLLCLLLSSVLIATFYINYLILIPKYLLAKKYVFYTLFMIIAISLVISVTGFTFFYTNFGDKTLVEFNTTAEKVVPVIIINALSLWLVSILSSILWVIYDRLKQTESERLSAQIASLKSQINPHFLFNTLNNIYATTIDSSPKAADMVDKLSEMMRYTMNESQFGFVALEDEINYVTNFIELQKVRLDKSVKLDYKSLENVSFLRIAPMLLIPFIENAFKHGVNSEQKSHIRIEMELRNKEFRLFVMNNKVCVQRDVGESNRLGIHTTKRRLELIYPSRHLLVIYDGEKEFTVSLNISLS